MQDLLIKRGFYKFHSCGCPGKPEKWRSDNYPRLMIKIYTSRNNFELYVNNRVTVKAAANKLEETLNQYAQ